MSLFHFRYLVFVGVMFVTGISVAQSQSIVSPEEAMSIDAATATIDAAKKAQTAAYDTATQAEQMANTLDKIALQKIEEANQVEQAAKVDTISPEIARHKNDEAIQAKTMAEKAKKLSRIAKESVKAADGVVTKSGDSLEEAINASILSSLSIVIGPRCPPPYKKCSQYSPPK